MVTEKEKLILVTNDDGYQAKGFNSLIESVRHLGRIIAIAPLEPQSGMSHAITVKHPLRVKKIKDEPGLEMYNVNGTPVDCVKLAINQILKEKPDMLVSGINHGSNSSSSILYSGTMGAALEGCLNHIPSVGFSHTSYDQDSDFTGSIHYASLIAQKVLEEGLPDNVCLNVNFPADNQKSIKGVKVCRQTLGFWREEFDRRLDPIGKEYFWLTGHYHNSEPDAVDTDEWALNNNYVAVVPVKTDLTSYESINLINKWHL